MHRDTGRVLHRQVAHVRASVVVGGGLGSGPHSPTGGDGVQPDIDVEGLDGAGLRRGVVFSVMNLSLYAAVERIGLGLAVTLEFLGPLTVAIAGSRRAVDACGALIAGMGVLLLTRPGGSADLTGVGFRLLAASAWGAYILLNHTCGRCLPGMQGTAEILLFDDPSPDDPDPWVVRPEPQRIELVDHDPSWTAQAEELCTRIADALGMRALRIEHVGRPRYPDCRRSPSSTWMSLSPTPPTRRTDFLSWRMPASSSPSVSPGGTGIAACAVPHPG